MGSRRMGSSQALDWFEERVGPKPQASEAEKLVVSENGKILGDAPCFVPELPRLVFDLMFSVLCIHAAVTYSTQTCCRGKMGPSSDVRFLARDGDNNVRSEACPGAAA